MEDPQYSLATESFSYSWFVNPSPSTTSRTLSCDLNESKAADQSFDFDVCLSDLSIVDADEIFSNGIMIPSLAGDPSKDKDKFMGTTQSSCSSHGHDRSAAYFPRRWRLFPRKWRVSTKDVVVKCLGIFEPWPASWCPNRGTSPRRCTRVDDLDRRSREVKSSLVTAPELVAASSSTSRSSGSASYSYKGNLSTDSESSMIHDAILYCKRCSGQ